MVVLWRADYCLNIAPSAPTACREGSVAEMKEFYHSFGETIEGIQSEELIQSEGGGVDQPPLERGQGSPKIRFDDNGSEGSEILVSCLEERCEVLTTLICNLSGDRFATEERGGGLE